MASTTKKGSKNTKTKPRRAVVKTSAVTQTRLIAELRQQLAQSLQRENATARELQDRKRELNDVLAQQSATSEILGVIASSPRDIQPVMDAIAESAVRLCEANDALIFRVEGDSLIRFANFGSRSQQSLAAVRWEGSTRAQYPVEQ